MDFAPATRMKSHQPSGLLLLAAGVSIGAFALLSRSVFAHRTSYGDGRARRQFPKRRSKVTKKVVHSLGYSGKPWVHGPFAGATALWLLRRGSPSGALAVGLSSVSAAAVSRAMERWLPHRAPPPGRHSPTEPSYPSGHTMETAAVATTIAYVMIREDVAPPSAAIPLALAIPAASGLGRLYLDRHWTSDVLGGWLAGVAIAAAASAVYEEG